MNNLSKFFTLISLTLAGSSFVSTPASALDFSLSSHSGDDYTYTVTLDAKDSLDIGDQLIITNLSGVTDASSNSPYSLNGFDTTSANFSVSTAASGPNTLTDVISLTSPDSLSDLEYIAFSSNDGSPNVATTNNAVAVPFGVSPNLGIILLVSGFGLRQLKRKFS